MTDTTVPLFYVYDERLVGDKADTYTPDGIDQLAERWDIDLTIVGRRVEWDGAEIGFEVPFAVGDKVRVDGDVEAVVTGYYNATTALVRFGLAFEATATATATPIDQLTAV